MAETSKSAKKTAQKGRPAPRNKARSSTINRRKARAKRHADWIKLSAYARKATKRDRAIAARSGIVVTVREIVEGGGKVIDPVFSFEVIYARKLAETRAWGRAFEAAAIPEVEA